MVEAKIGLEIHGYLDMQETKKKLFCNCKIDPNAFANTNICPICTGQPGNKPMPANKEALNKIITIARFLGCSVNKKLLFQRKHYSWPDLPNGYQKTMSGSYSTPVGENGEFHDVGITEVHLEEDPARWDPETGKVDYNRCGFPLVEIVSEPDLKDADQVRKWLKDLVTALSYIKAIDPDAGIKSDVNVSIGPDFIRTEIKNVNSIKSIVKAVEYELARQEKEINEGKKQKQQTVRWDDVKGETVFMRAKETAVDYMFIPDPDLPLIPVDEGYIKQVEEALPEKPKEKIEKFTKQGIDKVDAQVLASNRILAELFEKVSKKIDPVFTARWLRRELLRVINYNKLDLEKTVHQEKFSDYITELFELVTSKKITEKVAQKLMEKLVVKPFSPKEQVEKEGLGAVSDTGEIKKYCEEAIKENPKAIEDYKKGNEKALHFIVGQVMRKTKGKASPNELNNILKELLS
jgi:aspartyl-tRNA(Asn)/glutamyl-tRNA(Gln) amidotransferase subunit B